MNKNILLGLGAIGGAVYLATSKKAQAKVKKTTGLSDKIQKGQNVYVYKNRNGYNVLYFNASQGVYGHDFYDSKSDIDILKKHWKESGIKVHRTLPKNLKNRPTGLSDKTGGLTESQIKKIKDAVEKEKGKKFRLVEINKGNGWFDAVWKEVGKDTQYISEITSSGRHKKNSVKFNNSHSISKTYNKTGLSDSGKKAQAKEKVKKYLIKWGNNEKEATKMVNSSFEDAYNMYSPPLSPMKLAEIVISIYGVKGVER